MGNTQTLEKKCSRCHQVKNREHFHADKRRKDGLQAMCKECIATYQKQKEYNKSAPKPTIRGVQLAKKAIDVVEALPENNYNMHQAYASTTGKDLKNQYTYHESNKLWDDLSQDEVALDLFRRYIINDVKDIDLHSSFTKYFQEAMSSGSLGEKNSALSLTFKVLGWLEKKTGDATKPKIKTPEQRKAEREAFLTELEAKTQ